MTNRPSQPNVQPHRSLPWWSAAFAILVVGLVWVTRPALAQTTPQDGQAVSKAGTMTERRAIVHFASLAYQPTGKGKERRVRARDVARIQLVRAETGESYWLELFYHSGDYVMQKIDGLIFYRRDGTEQQMKVAVNLVGFDKIGFPFVN